MYSARLNAYRLCVGSYMCEEDGYEVRDVTSMGLPKQTVASSSNMCMNSSSNQIRVWTGLVNPLAHSFFLNSMFVSEIHPMAPGKALYITLAYFTAALNRGQSSNEKELSWLKMPALLLLVDLHRAFTKILIPNTITALDRLRGDSGAGHRGRKTQSYVRTQVLSNKYAPIHTLTRCLVILIKSSFHGIQRSHYRHVNEKSGN